MPKLLVEMVSEIVAAQASHIPMSPEDISERVRKVFEVLQNLQTLEAGMSGGIDLEASQGRRPQDSIHRNHVICLECHKEFKLLFNQHLALHGLTWRDYKLKYGCRLRQSLSAQSLTQARRKIAKEKGLGANLVAYQRRRKKQERA